MNKFVLLAMLFLLTGCFFNEPSQIEIEYALKDHFQAKLLHAGDGNLLGQVIPGYLVAFNHQQHLHGLIILVLKHLQHNKAFSIA